MKGLNILSSQPTYAETTINDIPFGSLFFGTIVHPTSLRSYTGFWIRGNGMGEGGTGHWKGNEMAISLDHHCSSQGHQQKLVVIRQCVPVKGYKLVKRAQLMVQEFA